jgi:hypothetical protein
MKLPRIVNISKSNQMGLGFIINHTMSYLVQEPFIGLDYLEQVKAKNVFAHVMLLKQIHHYKFTNGTL